MRRRHFGNVRKLPSGRYQASYFHDGRRFVAEDTFRAKADAQAYLSRIETDLHRGAWLDPTAGRMTVASLADLWLASNARKRASTRKRDETILRLHVLPLLGTRQITNVTPPDIQALVNGWTEAHAPSTVHRHYTCLAAVLSYAVDSDRLARTPCRRIRLPQVPEKARPELSAEELDRLASALGADQGPMLWLGAVGASASPNARASRSTASTSSRGR